MFLLIQNEQPYISKDFLLQMGIDGNTLKIWKTRYPKEWISCLSNAYFSYAAIPARTKNEKRIPAITVLIKEHEKVSKVETIYNQLVKAHSFDFTKHTNLFTEDTTLTTAEKTEAAKLYAVWNCLFELREKGNRDLQFQYEAFRQIYPAKYKGKTGKHSFSNVLRKGRDKGVHSLSIDGKKYGNNRQENVKKNKDAHFFYITHFASHSQKFTCSEMHQKVNELCKDAGLVEVSLSWIKKQRAAALKNPLIYESRYGQQEANKKMPNASLKSANYVHQQWQMDGFTLPFWGAKFKRLTLVRLQDSCSKKIVGYSIGESENTVLIMDALKDAVNKTGCIPFEVLTDNHAFNQTNEAKNLQQLFKNKGCVWTITQNPQHKAIIERYNQHLDNYFKSYFGYLGQGIRSKGIEAHPKPELIDRYCKDFIEDNEVKAIVVDVIETFNSTPLSNGKSPNQLFAENQHSQPITADIFDRAQLLTMQAEKKIMSGQVVFKRGIIKHEFQLPASLFAKYNDCTVLVRYEDLNECIYLFELSTGEPIITLQPKERINNAKANQTSEDIEKLNRHKGRITGIKSKARKDIEEITLKAHIADPEAYIRVNSKTTPKDVKAELERKGLLQTAAENGVDIDKLHTKKRSYGEDLEALKPKVKINDSPFEPKHHTLSKFNINDFLND